MTRKRDTPEAFPLERLRDELASFVGSVTGSSGRRMALKLGISETRLRELVAFYPELRRSQPQVQVCAGTSCFLAGGASIAAALPQAPLVHCLGHCDRSPCAARASGSVLGPCRPGSVREVLGDPLEILPSGVSVRCNAPEPIVTRNLIRADAASLGAARSMGAYAALEQALKRSPSEVLDAVEQSGERGRGGAGFPTGTKWRAAARSSGDSRVVIANGDEGDPGSFVDRLLLEDDPHSLLEGLALCAYAIGASEGVVFIRSEYPRAFARVRDAISEAETQGLLGERILGSDFSLRVRVASGFGSYVGGEETALLETLEGRIGEVRLRPPYPAEYGLEGRPTVVNNVETLVSIPWIVRHGADAYQGLGTDTSSGTKAICLNAGFAAPGIVEIELGRSLRTVIEEDGGADPDELEAVLLGGPMGSLLFPDEWDVALCYGALAERRIRFGHGGLVAIPRGVDWNGLLRHWLGFMARESCGRCLPCRDGSRRARDAVGHGDTSSATLDATLELIETASLCAFGKGAPGPARTLLARLGHRALEKRA